MMIVNGFEINKCPGVRRKSNPHPAPYWVAFATEGAVQIERAQTLEELLEKIGAKKEDIKNG